MERPLPASNRPRRDLHRALADASRHVEGQGTGDDKTCAALPGEVSRKGSARRRASHDDVPSGITPWSLPPPDAVDALRLDQLPAVAAHIATLQLRIAARLADELSTSEDLVTAPQAAKLLGMSLDWVYRNAKELPFTRRVGPRMLKFSKASIRRYLETRRS